MPFVTRLPALTGADPYPDALLALDFVGARRGPQYYKALGVTTSDVSKIPGWTYTGGTPAGTGSYAARADGSLQFFPSYTNLLLQSQTFDNASWTKVNATVSADATTAPNGTTTADLWTRTATASSYITQALTKTAASVTYTQSMWVKKSVGDYFALRLQGTYPSRSDVVFNLSTGQISSAVTVGGSFTSPSATITPSANGFYFITLTATTDTASTLNPLYSFNSNGVAADGTDSVSNSAGYIWGAQLELGSTASTYIPTTTAAVTVGTPRITDAGYWAEEARTNLLLRSQEFDNASWGKTATTVTANQAVAPDGTTTFDLVTASGGAGEHHTSQSFSATSGQAYTASVYAKAGTENVLVLWNSQAGSMGSVNLATGAVTGGVTATLAGSGVYFVAATFTASATASREIRFYIKQVSSYTSAGESLYLWQADLQAGSFATSPIPTTSVAVTRAADVGYVSGIAIPTTGTMVATVNVPTTANDQFLAFASDGTLLNRIYVNAQGSNGNGQSGIFASAVGNTAAVASVITGSAKTVAMAYTAGAQSTTANGANPVAGSIASVPSVTRFDVGGGGAATATRQAQGPIRRIVIYPRAFGNSELQAITTAGAY